MSRKSKTIVRIPRTWRRLTQAQRGEAQRRSEMRARAAAALAPVESAKAAGLRYVNDAATPGIRRLGRPGRFRYVDPDRRPVTNASELQRIRTLAIPPAWTDVWICPIAAGHLQATGRDARGRKQYRYHARWREVRDEVKYGRLLSFADALPAIRLRTNADLQKGGLPREKVLATVVELLAKTFIRIGNEEYARENGAIGLTTMRDAHAKVDGSSVRFEFRGKSGVRHAIDLHDPRLARIVRACRDLPGYELFQWVDGAGVRQSVDSADVNAYLREASGADFTAKDFRTWAGTVLAWRTLSAMGCWKSRAEAARNVVKAVGSVAARLGNTRSVCRKCYIHPAVIEAYQQDAAAFARTASSRQVRTSRLEPDEAAVVQLIAGSLRARLRRSA